MLGAVGSYAFAVRLLDQELQPVILIVLGIAVWIIYLADHLLDSYRNEISNPDRYTIFFSNRIIFQILILLLLFAEGILVTAFLNFYQIVAGLGIGAAMAIYFLTQHFLTGNKRRFFPKELIISIIYALAIWTIPLLEMEEFELNILILVIIHFLLVFSNVMLFSIFEREEDKKRISFFTRMSVQTQRTLIMIMNALCIAVILFSISGNYLFSIPLLVISFTYFLEAMFSEKLFIRKFYREITDGVFMIFLVFLFPKFSV